ncbi:hypothetical protein ABFX02_04G170200 [Erythranthe guttata]
MAYAAVISLKQTIERLLNSSQISLVPPSKKFIKSAYKHVQSLQEVLKRFDSCNNKNNERVNALDDEIGEKVRKLEDVIESHLSNQFLSQYEQSRDEDHEITHPSNLSVEMEEVKQEIDSFNETIKKMECEYINELNNSAREEEDAVLSRIGFPGKKSTMVGLSDQFREIQMRLLDRTDTYNYYTSVSLVGMAGIGKTTLAMELFEDPLISSHFDCRAFVNVGQKYELKQILQSILAQMNPEIEEVLKEGGLRSLYDLKRIMYPNFKGKRYLIVLDDVWNNQVWGDLRRLLPNNKNGSRVLLTSRLQLVPYYVSDSNNYQIRLLNKEESWDLLRHKVFDEMPCPLDLERAGKKIAENCEGLPLLVVIVAEILSKADRTPKYWKQVAEKENAVFMDANDQILKVLFSSYEYLPQHLKACFLYMGVFPPNYEIPRSKLIKLLSVEGFLEPVDPSRTIESFSMECLKELVSKSLVIVHQKRSNSPYNYSLYNFKTCGLHSVFWHLCKREAEKNKFSRVVNSYDTSLGEGIEHQRRLCIHKSILFANKDVYESIASISNTRSLLCFGPYHKYPVPICLEYLRLLRVFDALTIRMYEFPMEVLKLVQLRYLALTYDGNLPPSISKLRNLQFLIILRHLNIIKSCIKSSYLPMEIWDMQELKHLQITGSNLPDPCGAILLNLSTLLDISPHCCRKEILERIPRLEKLGIRFDLAHDHDAKSLNWFDAVSNHTRTVKCVVVNPIPRSEVVVGPPAPLFTNIYSRLAKLSLSGFGYPWEDISKIASLPCLHVLKLRRYAFRGAKWETQDKSFRSLEVLLIEDSDLVEWTAGFKTFRCLEHLTLKNCHKLEQIPRDLYIRLNIELVDCNASAVACVKQMQEEERKKDRNFPKVYVYSSV